LSDDAALEPSVEFLVLLARLRMLPEGLACLARGRQLRPPRRLLVNGTTAESGAAACVAASAVTVPGPARVAGGGARRMSTPVGAGVGSGTFPLDDPLCYDPVAATVWRAVDESGREQPVVGLFVASVVPGSHRVRVELDPCDYGMCTQAGPQARGALSVWAVDVLGQKRLLSEVAGGAELVLELVLERFSAAVLMVGPSEEFRRSRTPHEAV
jgi:hypothetical protein